MEEFRIVLADACKIVKESSRKRVISGADEDGRVMVEFSEPVGGRRVKMLTPDEINGMLYKEETSESPANAEEAMAEETEPPTAGQEESGESAFERIPKDTQTGEPQYTQTDAPTAWDAIVEQTEGDEDMARSVVDSTVSDKEAALKKLESSNPKPGATVAEKIAAAKEHKAAIEAARQELEQWKAIAEVENSRKAEAEAEAKAKAEEEEAKARAKAEAEEETGVKLSDEIDENGRQFVLTSNGDLAFGEIGKNTGLTEAPILLSEGVITNTSTNDGYGLAHIEARHGEQIRKAGYKSVIDFIEKVAKNYDVIKKGSLRDGRQTYRLQLTDKHNNTLMVELSDDGTYWNINTAGIFKTSYGKKNEEVYNRHTTVKQSVETVETSQDTEQSDTQVSPSMNVPTTSTGKVSESPETKQEKAEKSISAKVKEASADVNTEPTEAQKEAGNYKKGHVQVGTFDITIEQPEGSIRRGTDADGKQWEVRSSDHTKPEYYGEAQKPVELTYYKDKQGEENLSVSVDLGTSGYNIEDMKALMAEIDRLKNDAGEVKESFDKGVVSDEAAKRYPLLSQALGVKSENEVRAKEEAREHAEEARKQEMRSAVEDMAGKLHLNNVDIVDKPAGRGAGRRERAKGMFERSTGRITINIGNCADKRDAVVTLLHEAVAHHGLRKLFGENFETFLDNVYNSANAEIRRIIDKHSSRYGGDKRTATEEYMASLAERTDFENAKKSGWWQRIKDFFLKMLEKIGLKGFKGEDLSDNELRYVLWRSYENLKSGGKDTVFSAADDLAKQSELNVGEFAPNAKKTAPEENAEEVNERFNEQLGGLTADNADNVVLSLGRPSKVLLSAGVENKPMTLYGNKVIKKMRKHGFALEELRNLPRAVADPIAVFNNYGENGNRSILTELKTLRGNFLVSVNIGKGADVDFNIVSSVFGKGSGNVADWINKGYMTYVDKEKALNYLHHSALRAVTSDSSRLSSEDPAVLPHQSAPIAATAANAEFSSAAKVVENFENPKSESKNDILFRDGAAKDYEKAQAREAYERRVSTGMFQSREAIQDSMLSLKVAMDAIEEATAGKAKRIEDYDGFENAYLGENRLSSVNQAESAAFAHLLIRPMMEEVNRLAPTAKDRAELIDYMFAKHGLERNAYMRQQAAEKKLAEYKKQNPGTAKTAADFIDAERDYAGLTTLTGEADVSAAEAEAQRMVADYEKDYTFHGTWNEIYVCRKKIC